MLDDVMVHPAVIRCPNMLDIPDHNLLLEIVILGAEPQKILRGHSANVDPLVLVSGLFEGLLFGLHTGSGGALWSLWIAIMLRLCIPWGVRAASTTCDTKHTPKKSDKRSQGNEQENAEK